MGLSVKETTRRGEGESTRGISERSGKRTFDVRYDATTPPANLVAVETANDGTTAIPSILSALPGDSSRLCKSIGVKPAGDGTGLYFKVDCDYDDAYSIFETVENPLDEPARIDWGGSEATEKWFKDKTTPDPLPYQNSAGCPFAELPERRCGTWVVTITKNMASFPVALAKTMRFKTNSDTFALEGVTIAVGEALHGLITAGPFQVRNGTEYREVKATLYLAETHEHIVDDMGFQELVDGELVDIVKGQPPTRVDTPAPLDGAGHWAWDEGIPAELTFQPYASVAFSSWVTAFGVS